MYKFAILEQKNASQTSSQINKNSVLYKATQQLSWVDPRIEYYFIYKTGISSQLGEFKMISQALMFNPSPCRYFFTLGSKNITQDTLCKNKILPLF